MELRDVKNYMTRMAAEIGNNYWTLRKTHGRSKLFDDPQHLWSEALEYFTWVSENPFIKTEKKEGDKTETKTIQFARPFTEEGFCSFVGISKETWSKYKKGKESYKDFVEVSEAIVRIISNNKFEGAAAGIFNASIIARDLGLADKQSHEVKLPKVIEHNPTTDGSS